MSRTTRKAENKKERRTKKIPVKLRSKKRLNKTNAKKRDGKMNKPRKIWRAMGGKGEEEFFQIVEKTINEDKFDTFIDLMIFLKFNHFMIYTDADIRLNNNIYNISRHLISKMNDRKFNLIINKLFYKFYKLIFEIEYSDYLKNNKKQNFETFLTNNLDNFKNKQKIFNLSFFSNSFFKSNFELKIESLKKNNNFLLLINAIMSYLFLIRKTFKEGGDSLIINNNDYVGRTNPDYAGQYRKFFDFFVNFFVDGNENTVTNEGIKNSIYFDGFGFNHSLMKENYGNLDFTNQYLRLNKINDVNILKGYQITNYGTNFVANYHSKLEAQKKADIIIINKFYNYFLKMVLPLIYKKIINDITNNRELLKLTNDKMTINLDDVFTVEHPVKHTVEVLDNQIQSPDDDDMFYIFDTSELDSLIKNEQNEQNKQIDVSRYEENPYIVQAQKASDTNH
jgi:hypothetical protein